MPLNTDSLKRSLDAIDAALAMYGGAETQAAREVYRMALVKGFELAQETSFKLLKKHLREFGHGPGALDATPVKDLLRLAARHGVMTPEEVGRWFAYRENRNDTAHDYGEGFTQETLRLLPKFVEDAKHLEAKLRTGRSDT